MLTKPYAALAVGARVRLYSKEVVPMRGRNPIPFDRHPLTMLVGAIVVVVGVLAAIVIGPGELFHFLFSFLLPMAVILLVVGMIGLAVQGGAKVLDSKDQPPSTNVRNPSRGEGLSDPVYWLLMSLFSLASVAIAYFFWLVVRDQWIHDKLLVAGRFYEAETLRVLFLLLATVAVSSGLVWRHYRKIASYGSPLEPFFMLVFTLCAALAAVAVLLAPSKNLPSETVCKVTRWPLERKCASSPGRNRTPCSGTSSLPFLNPTCSL